MGELGALFNPGMRHELEERRSKAARREEEGNARDGDLHIDLASGVAVINIPADDDADESPDPAAAAAGSAETDPSHTAEETDPTDTAAAGEANAAPAAEQPPAPLRPRGKRGMTSSSR